MNLYLAESGGILKAYISGGEEMNLYLADSTRMKSSVGDGVNGCNILQSFYYADEWTERIIPFLKSFLLDSGAFTFFTSGKHVDWNDYIKRYASFIVKNEVKLFFELDIDSLIGYQKVLYYREMLEDMTGRKCIPVWHKSRGLDAYKEMCESYDYIAIGGIVSKEIKPNDYRYFPYLINEAHSRNAKVHGLGFTNLAGLPLYHFDSVDSTSWTSGNRFGHVWVFDGNTMQKIDKKTGQRMANTAELARHNFKEWVKFSEYAEVKL